MVAFLKGGARTKNLVEQRALIKLSHVRPSNRATIASKYHFDSFWSTKMQLQLLGMTSQCQGQGSREQLVEIAF